MSITVDKKKDSNSIEAMSNNFIRIDGTFYKPRAKVVFERTPVAYYTSLELSLESPASQRYYKKFDDIGDFDIVGFFKKNISEELSAGFAYPKSGEGILIAPAEINAIYVPLLKAINHYIKESR